MFCLIPKTPLKVMQGSWQGPRLPEQCRGMSLEGAAGLAAEKQVLQ